MTVGNVKRRRVNSPQKVRSFSVQYHLHSGNGEKVRVCRQFFCNTFGISKKVVENITKKTSLISGRYKGEHGNTGRAPKCTTPARTITKVALFISQMPKMPSHYCRADSKRLYFEATWNMASLHRAYNEQASELHKVSLKVFKKVFNQWEPTLGFFVPKKDQCTTCNTGVESDPEYCAHVHRKKTIRAMKAADKAEAKMNPSKRFVTFDMQATLTLPFAEDSQLYYARKLSVYNVSIYDSEKNGICHVYDETNGAKGSTEIASCLLDYLSSLLESVEHVIFYADTCEGRIEINL